MMTVSDFLESNPEIYSLESQSMGPQGKLPITEEWLTDRPSGDLFGLSQDAGMGWDPSELGRDPFLILSTLGGLRAPDGRPVALGYHTGHWELGLLVQAAAEEFRALRTIPFAGFVSDPCDGRTQGTVGMMDSLAYRNDAAIVLRRLIRSLPNRKGVVGIATCDKGLPAMMMAVAGIPDLPSVIVPGGVTLPPISGEDAGKVQTLGARYSHGLVTLDEAAELGCRACASPGGGCQFLGTAATAQVVAEALGLSLPHSALAPSGAKVWRNGAVLAARAVRQLAKQDWTTRRILTAASIRNAMVVHAAFGGSTNLLLHIPAIAHAAGLPRPKVEDWKAVNRTTPRLVSVLPNGPVHHPTVRVFLAGGVPEVMLHLRDLQLLDLEVGTVTGSRLGDTLEAWERSDRRQQFRDRLKSRDGVSPEDVILPPPLAKARGLTSTVAFPRGNLAPEGSVIKSTAIDPTVIDSDGVYRFEGPARVFVREREAITAIKLGDIKPGDVLVLMGAGPTGTGMEETYQLTSALKHLPWGRSVALITDARFSGVSTGACIGHIGPEALAGGPLGRLRDGDRIRIRIDCQNLDGSVDLVIDGTEMSDVEAGAALLSQRTSHAQLVPHPALPDDTRLWAVLQAVSGGTWGGCVFDVDAIASRLRA
jgi:putative YjhG/YagF family dehydratase